MSLPPVPSPQAPAAFGGPGGGRAGGRGRRTALWIAAAGVAVLVLLAAVVVVAVVVVAVVVVRKQSGVADSGARPIPTDWSSTDFAVTADNRSRQVRDDAGRVLVGRLAASGVADARYEVVDGGVRVGVDPSRADALEQFRAAPPIVASLELRPVVSSAPASAGSCREIADALCGADGKTAFQLEAAVADGSQLADAKAEVGESTGHWQVLLTFTDVGSKRIADVTAALVDRQLAIVVGGVVVSAPMVMQQITGGVVVIAGAFHGDEARYYAAEARLGRDRVQISAV